MTRSQKAALRRLNAQLEAAGIDPAPLQTIAPHFVRAADRIEGLHDVEAQARGKAKAAATRSLNVALAEKAWATCCTFRQLDAGRQRTWSPPEEIKAARHRLEADAAF